MPIKNSIVDELKIEFDKYDRIYIIEEEGINRIFVMIKERAEREMREMIQKLERKIRIREERRKEERRRREERRRLEREEIRRERIRIFEEIYLDKDFDDFEDYNEFLCGVNDFYDYVLRKLSDTTELYRVCKMNNLRMVFSDINHYCKSMLENYNREIKTFRDIYENEILNLYDEY